MTARWQALSSRIHSRETGREASQTQTPIMTSWCTRFSCSLRQNPAATNELRECSGERYRFSVLLFRISKISRGPTLRFTVCAKRGAKSPEDRKEDEKAARLLREVRARGASRSLGVFPGRPLGNHAHLLFPPRLPSVASPALGRCCRQHR